MENAVISFVQALTMLIVTTTLWLIFDMANTIRGYFHG